jgi:threonine synthase
VAFSETCSHSSATRAEIVTIGGEGRTNLQRADGVAREVGMDVDAGGQIFLQYEGFNPSGSLAGQRHGGGLHARQDGERHPRRLPLDGEHLPPSPSTAPLTGMRCFVFIGDGKIAYGKLSQALEYGAVTLQVAGDFDACLARVRRDRRARPEQGIYLMNSVNPFRLEGQKSIMYRILEGLDWKVPDWIVVPGATWATARPSARPSSSSRRSGSSIACRGWP